MKSKFLKCLVLACGLISAATSSFAQITREEVGQIFLEMVADKNEVRKMLRGKIGSHPHRREYEDHLYAMLSNQIIRDAVADEFYRNVKKYASSDGSVDYSKLASFTTAWFQSTADAGIKRLSVSDQTIILEGVIEIFEGMSDKQCGGVFKGTMSANEMQKADLAGTRSLSSSEFSKYVELHRHAMVAEILDRPKYVPLTRSQTTSAEDAISERFFELLEKQKNSEDLFAALDDEDTADVEDLCQAYRQYYRAHLGIEGKFGEWSVRYFFADM